VHSLVQHAEAVLLPKPWDTNGPYLLLLLYSSAVHVQEAAAQLEGAGAAAASLLPAAAESLAGQAAAIRDQTAPAVSTRIPVAVQYSRLSSASPLPAAAAWSGFSGAVMLTKLSGAAVGLGLCRLQAGVHRGDHPGCCRAQGLQGGDQQ
jgi:hypothetical protein